MRSSVVILLAAASVSEAYVQLQIKSRDERNPSALQDFTLSSLVTQATSDKKYQFTAVRDASPLTQDEDIFWAATWTVHHEPGASRGVCTSFPCNLTPRAGGDRTLYNMAKANKQRKDSERRKWKPDTYKFLQHLYFLSFEDKGHDGAIMGTFKPHSITGFRSRVWSKVSGWVMRTENTPWKFLTINNWVQSRNENNIDKPIKRPEFDLDIEGPQEWFICYEDPAKAKEPTTFDKVTAITVNLVTRAMDPRERICDRIYLHARILTPESGNFKDVKGAEMLRRLFEQTMAAEKEKSELSAEQAVKLHKPQRLNEGMNDIILGKPEIPVIEKQRPIDLDDIQIEESPEEYHRQQKFDEAYENDLKVQRDIRGSIVSEDAPPRSFNRQKTVAMDGKNWDDHLRGAVLGEQENGLEICVLGARKKNTTWLKRKC